MWKLWVKCGFFSSTG